jgi:nitrogen regulatory protein P-II 1
MGGADMKMITGIVRTSCLERIVKALEGIEIRELTFSEVKGTGKQVMLNNAYAVHTMMQIIVPDEVVHDAADAIVRHACTGMAGDGIVVVSPIDYVIKIRTKERVE